MKKFWLNLRWFLMGFVPALCVMGLAFGLFFAWVNSRAALIPQQAALEVESLAPGEWEISVSGERWAVSLPEIPAAGLLEQYPVLIPHSVRLLAWGRNAIEENFPGWEEYLRGSFAK